jgi:hypothetical protein
VLAVKTREHVATQRYAARVKTEEFITALVSFLAVNRALALMATLDNRSTAAVLFKA